MSKNNTIKIKGNVKGSTVFAGDNNKITNIINNFICNHTGLSPAELKPIVEFVLVIAGITAALTLIFFAIILFVFYPAETISRTDIVHVIVSFFIMLVLTCMFFIIVLSSATYLLSKAYKNIKALIIILMIPFCMAISIVSASYLLDEPVENIIDRIVSPSDDKKTDNPDDTKLVKPKPEPRPAVTPPEKRPDDKPSGEKPEATKPIKPVKPDEHDSKPHVSYSAKKPIYPLRSQPITVSSEDAERVFGLKKVSEPPFPWLRPLEYIQNEFEDNRDGTITDHATGLIWQQSGSPNYIYLKDVPAYIEKLNREKFAGYSDWRLPTVDELKSLITENKQSNDLYINSIFDKTQRWCWTSDNRASGGAWLVFFDFGDVNWYDDGGSYVRAVRSRQ